MRSPRTPTAPMTSCGRASTGCSATKSWSSSAARSASSSASSTGDARSASPAAISSDTELEASGAVECQHLQLGHLFDRVANPFPSGAGVLDTAVRHVVDPERGDVVDHQTARLQPLERLVNEPLIVGEQPGLQPEPA